MDDYLKSAQLASKVVTQTFSTSFSSAITLFSESIRQDIYNIYGLVRVADEIVDSYQGDEAEDILNQLEQEVYQSIKRGFSANVIVQSFCITANRYSIDKSLIEPFFSSMRMDLTIKTFSKEEYKNYIYGSAEVVGLMCLKVFVDGEDKEFNNLKEGVCALGSAFQKVNFLRDIKDDYNTRGRYYFPVGSFENFSEQIKSSIIDDIEKDFKVAQEAIEKLPKNARFATRLAFDYYNQLLSKLKITPADEIKNTRISVSKTTKLKILMRVKLAKHVQ